MKHFLTLAFFIITALQSQSQLLAIKFTDNGSPIADQDNFWYWQEWGQDWYTYNSSCQLETDLFKWTPGDGMWKDGFKTIYFYNNFNQNIKQVDLYFNSGTQQWDSSRQILTEYGNDDKPSVLTIQNFVNNNWQNNTRNIKTYNQRKKDSTFLEEKWENNKWKKTFLFAYTYNERDSVELRSYQVFNRNKIDSSTTRFTYRYDAFNRIDSILSQVWDTDHWSNNELKKYAYTNISYYTCTILTQRWNGLNNSWENSLLESMENDLNGYPIEWTIQTWESGYFWRNFTRTIYNFGYQCVLPLRFISFTGIQENKKVNLRWQTSDEINNGQYEVERSNDGIHFTNIGTVKAKQGSTHTNYTYTDNISLTNTDKLFYRLQAVSKDGETTFSRIIPINISGNKFDIDLRPNPAKEYIKMVSPVKAFENAFLCITDVSGRIILKRKIQADQTVDIHTLKPGLYFVKIIYDGMISQKKLVVE